MAMDLGDLKEYFSRENVLSLSADLAPVLVLVYDRVEHLRNCIESLARCPEASQTKLYIASDAARSANHSMGVNIVRSYISTITAFCQVCVFERVSNLGVLDNYYNAVGYLLERHDRLIFLQDDVVVSNSFLRFLNEGLRFYQSNPSVISVCSYVPPYLDGASKDIFFMQRREPYGFGMWRHKEASFLQPEPSLLASKVLTNRRMFNEFCRIYPNVVTSLPLISAKLFQPGDYEASLVMYFKKLLAVYPSVSLSRHIGADGTGMHASFDQSLVNQKITDDYIFEFGKVFPRSNESFTGVMASEKSRSLSTFLYPILYYGNLCVPCFPFILSLILKLKRALRGVSLVGAVLK